MKELIWETKILSGKFLRAFLKCPICTIFKIIASLILPQTHINKEIMKNRWIILLLGFVSLLANAQENYTTLTEKALKTMRKAKDSTGYKKALNMYEEAFGKFPDSINTSDLYHSSVLASNLKNLDKAFKYLTPLSKIEKDEDGYPGWDYIIGDYAKKEYKNLLNDPRWKALEKKAIINKKEFLKKLNEAEKEFFKTAETSLNHKKGEKLYQKLKTYHPYLPKKQQDYSISLKIDDSTKTSYLVHLPKNYTPKKSYPLLVFLHGAVRQTILSDFQIPESNLGGWNRFYTKYANENDVILVFLSGSKKYNWMIPDDGFFMVSKMIKEIKKAIHVDDNKIFISGHSNGATGSFSYLMKQPTLFAGMYGFNTHPKVYTGGTFIENIKNRSFINFSTDQDYYYPPNANDSLNELMRNIKADYKDYRYNGFPHWFPKFDESEPAYKILFTDINKRERNPFPKEISWEFDNNKYGNIDWLNNIQLDTLQQKKTWHKNLNFKITKWYGYNKNDSLVSKKVNINAFEFPRKSGKIIAEYAHNTFKIKTSRIKYFKIYLSPEMVNLNKKIKVYVNGKLYFNEKVKYYTSFMLENFDENKDTKQIWVNYIPVDIKADNVFIQ